MAENYTCDGVRRRDFLKAGALGGAFSLASYYQLASAGQVNPMARASSAIFINLAGGPTHMDTFDLKPNAPDEYRGEFRPIATNAPGVEFSEHLPKLAQCADKFVVMRGVSHTLAAHALGSLYVNTGNKPLPSLEFPGFGAVVTKELGGPIDLPPYVAVPDTPQKAGYLGVRYAPMSTGAVPKAGSPFTVRGISLRGGLTVDEIERRQTLLTDLDQTFSAVEKDSQLLDGLDRFSQQAHSVITSRRAREAFDISKESPQYAGMFGDTSFGMSCLLASRLVESGVKFVTLNFGGWDTHNDCFTRLKTNLLPQLDTGLAALFSGLAMKGMLESTAVIVTGEFGRTPKVNQRTGRDHYPRAMFMLLAGGGFGGGRVLGASDDKGTGPADKGYSPGDIAATFYTNLGIDPTKEYDTTTGRPVMIVRDGTVIPELFV